MSDNKDALWKIVNSDDSFKSVSRETANVINVVTKSGFKIDEKDEIVDMCEAVLDIREDGREEGQLITLVNLAEKKIVTIEQAAEEAGMSIDEFLEKMTVRMS